MYGTRESAHTLDARITTERIRMSLLGVRARPVRIQSYDLRRRLGAGSMGVVYEAFDVREQRTVALKLLKRAVPSEIARLKDEFRTIGAIQHRNLARVHELASTDGSWFFTMEYVHGVSLQEHIRAEDLPADRLLELLPQLFDGVAAIHRADQCHGDLKPSNVLWEDASKRVVIVDFGLAATSGALGYGGTRGYLAPERTQGAGVSAQADCFALGMIALELLRTSTDGPGGLAPLVRERLTQLARALVHATPTLRPSAQAAHERLLEVLAAGSPARSMPSVPQAALRFFNRDRELEQLTGALQAIVGSQRAAHVLLVTGPEGIGKSALLRRLVADVPPTVWRCRATCGSQEGIRFPALDGLMDALAGHMRKLAPHPLSRLPRRHRQTLLDAFPALTKGQRGPLSQPMETASITMATVRRHVELQDALVALLHACAESEQSLVLVLDELDHGDADSGELLAGTLSRCKALPICFIGACRTLDQAGFPAAFHTGARAGDLPVTSLAVGPLCEADTRALVRSRAAGAPEAQVLTLAALAGGVPYLAQLLADNRDRVPAMTTDLDSAIGAIAGSLAAAARRALLLIALADQPPRELTLARAFARLSGGDDLAPHLDGLLKSGLLRLDPVGCLHCAHPALPRIVSERVGATEREAAHHALALAYCQTTFVRQAELVHQVRAAGRGSELRRYALVASRTAHRAHAFASEAQWIRLALEGQAAKPKHPLLQARLARALASAGEHLAAAEVYREAASTARTQGDEALAQRCARHEVRQLLRAGRIRSALASANGLLRDHGLHIPRDGRAALPALLRERVALAAGIPPRPGLALRGAPERIDRDLVDTLGSFALEFASISPIAGGLLQARYLREARAAGAARHELRALVGESTWLGRLGGRYVAGQLARIGQQIKRLAMEIDTDYAHGMAALCDASDTLWSISDAPRAVARSEDALAYLESVPDAAWERHVCHMLHLYGCELAFRSRPCIEGGLRNVAPLMRSRDVFSMMFLQPSAHSALLMTDRVREVHVLLDHCEAIASAEAPVLLYQILSRRAQTWIYEGPAAERLPAFSAACGSMFSSGFSWSAANMRPLLARFEARMNIAAYFETGDEAYLKQAEQLGRRLLRGSPAMRAYGHSSLAAVHQGRGENRQARARLVDALAAFRAIDMGGGVQAVRYHLSRMDGDAATERAILSSARAEGIVRPARLLQSVVPLEPRSDSD